MASSRSSRSGPVSLHEIRQEQRRVAALMRASGQVEVSFPPRKDIPPQELFKGRFYRRVVASLPNSRVPPLGHQLMCHPPLKDTDPEEHGVHRHRDAMAALAPALINSLDDDGKIVPITTGRQPPATKRTLSTSLPASIRPTNEPKSRHPCRTLRSQTQLDASSGSDPAAHGDTRNSRSCQRKSFSNFETLPGIKQSPVVEEKESKVSYRLPRWKHNPDIRPELMTPPHLHYNLGDAKPPGNFDPLADIGLSSPPSGWKGEGTSSDATVRGGDGPGRRKRKRHHYGLQECISDSLESSSSSSSPPLPGLCERAIDDDNPSRQSEDDVDQHASSNRNSSDFSDYPLFASPSSPTSESLPGETESRAIGPKLRNRNRADDPYGRAYVQALSVARSKEFRADPLHLSQRTTRAFTFSYFCHKEICECGNCPPEKRKKRRDRSDRKTGFKAIFGDVNVYDYFKWPNDGHE